MSEHARDELDVAADDHAAATAADTLQLEPSRLRFRSLIAANPNHFGTLDNTPLGELFKAVEPKTSDTRYEEIGCVAYSPERDRLEATIVIKQANGYLGGACSAGSTEFVRFFVDFGGGWVDAGVAATPVHDMPVGTIAPRTPTTPTCTWSALC